MDTLPNNIGAVIKITMGKEFGVCSYIYSRNVVGSWQVVDRCGSLRTLNHAEISELIDDKNKIVGWEVLSEGYVKPIDEPLGLGAVVVCGGTQHLRILLKDNFAWATIPFIDSWFSWDELTRKNEEIKVLSEGLTTLNEH